MPLSNAVDLNFVAMDMDMDVNKDDVNDDDVTAILIQATTQCHRAQRWDAG